VLVLGLTGSGKSTIVSKLNKQIVEAQKKGVCDVFLITDNDQAYNIWDSKYYQINAI